MSLSTTSQSLRRRFYQPCPAQSEQVFGPQVDGCLQNFDFTLLFEETILSIPTSSIFLLFLVPRLFVLSRKSVKVRRGLLYYIKLIGLVILALLQLVVLVLNTISSVQTKTVIGTSALSFIASILLLPLSSLEHTRAIRPSNLAIIYLFVSMLCDVPRARTLYSVQGSSLALAIVFSAAVVLRAILTIIESWSKVGLLSEECQTVAPESASGIFGRSLFLWLNPLLCRGHSSILSLESLLEVDEALNCTERGPARLEKVWQQVSQGRNKQQRTLLIACVKYGFRTLVAGALPRALQIGFTMAQPFLVHATVEYVEYANVQDPAIRLNGHGLIAAFGFVYCGIAISTPAATHQAYRLSTMLRAQLIDMIYAKTMNMHSSDIEESAPLTLMSADIERVSSGLRCIHDAWGCIIEIGIALWLLWLQLGVAAIAPIVVAVVCMIAALGVSALAGPRQELWLKAIEKRVDATAKILGSMKTVKMTGLEQKMSTILQNFRAIEITKSEKFRQLLIVVVGFAYTNVSISPVISFTIWALTDRSNNGSGLTSSQAFTSLTLFTLLATPISTLVEAAAGVATAVGSIERINTFLYTTSRQDDRAPSLQQSSAGSSEPEKSRQSWTDIVSSNSEDIVATSVVKVPDGCGDNKSIIGSTVILAKDLTAGWSEKEPVSAGPLSIVVHRSTLTMIVGPVGCGKSTILRSMLAETKIHDGTLIVPNRTIAYCSQTPWLTNSTLQSNILGESLYDMTWYDTVIKACALDKDIKDIPLGDQTLVGTQGAVLSGGQKQRVALARAVYSKIDTIVLDDAISGLDSSTENEVFHALLSPEGLLRKNGTTVIMTTNNVQRLPFADYVVVVNGEGKIAEQGTWQELRDQGSTIQEFVNQNSARSTKPNARDLTQELPLADPLRAAEEVPADRQYGDTTIYFYYARIIGYWRSLVFLVLMICYVFFVSFPGLWVQWWAKAKNPSQDLGYWLGIYAFFGVMAISFIIASCWHLMSNMVAVTARSLHLKLLTTVQNAPMSFFSTTDIGRTTNRFSQDLQLVDMELPLSVLNTVLSALVCLAQLIIVCISTTYIATTLPAFLAVFYIIQRYYLRTSRQLRYMEIEAKAPLFAHFIETLSGISTIRSYAWEEQYQSKSRTLTNSSQKPLYLLFSLQRWLELVIGLSVAGFAVVLSGVVVAVTDANSLGAGFVGLALLNLVTLSENLQALILQWTVLETSIGAVARIRDFEMNAASENKEGESGVPPENWPNKGVVEFRDVVASYTEDRPVLDKISFAVAPGQKVAICGRTGSGKSSLISALLRILDMDTGSIYIDGQDISTLPRSTVRSRLNVIAQEPYFFPGTLRQNLDPSDSLPDQTVIDALKKIQRWDEVEALGGLDVQVTQDLFSPGEKQLLSIARVLCYSSGRVLVFDEATSSIDHKTEVQLRAVIAEHFSQHTVIEVAHRLDSILDFDLVLLMDKGSIIESGRPRSLLERGQESAFGRLYNDLKSD